MISLLVTAQVWLEEIRGGIRRAWRRILLGAFGGWAAATVFGAFALAFAAPWISSSASNMLGVVIVWLGIVLGGLVGYSTSSSDGCP